ncbi:hypothetical protein [Amycolatopsis solani]|uniref:hypothetical protein n=1 Tax=Amycolatopsis solani TaxID=3028615 RepID=UPI0025AFAC95|nr:hypothetical protein [Amycolatopsis sp. MEP2-6]
MKYLAMFPAGADRVVIQVLEGNNATIVRSDESSVLFTTPKELSADQLLFANNVFEILVVTKRKSIDGSVEKLVQALGDNSIPRSGTFRTMCHFDGRLAPMSPASRRTLERALARRGAKFTPRGGGSEFWVIGRRDWPDVVLGRRMDLGRKGKGAKGALSPQIAWLLASLSSPTPSDVVFDPFAGSGAILEARARWKYRELVYNDAEHNDASAKLRLRNLRSFHIDVLAGAPPVKNVNKIITDPPWGEYEEVGMPYADFTSKWWQSTASCRSPGGGSLVVLVNRTNESALIEALSRLDVEIERSAPLLINGHPAAAVCGSWPARS